MSAPVQAALPGPLLPAPCQLPPPQPLGLQLRTPGPAHVHSAGRRRHL